MKSKKKIRSAEATFNRYKESDFNSLLEVGLALSSERETPKIMDTILEQALTITSADGVSIYLIEKVKQDSYGGARPDSRNMLRFHKVANRHLKKLNTNKLIEINENSIAGYVAHSSRSVRVRDVYLLSENEPFKFFNSFDQQSNYRTKSVLAVPIKTAKGRILGVLQLINKLRPEAIASKERWRRPPEKSIIAFSSDDEKLMQGFASQAAIALENAKLNQDINNLFESFVTASVTAIEARDPTTSGHSDRVANLSVAFAQTIDRLDSGSYEKIHFSGDQIRELRYAALLHDFGKIGVREDVLLKGKKLYANELETILLRLQASQLKNETLVWKEAAQKITELAAQGQTENLRSVLGEAALQTEEFSRQVADVKDKIYQANEPQVMSADFNIRKLIQWVDNMSKRLGQLVLTPAETDRLSIARGTLSKEERQEIESHVSHTYTFLSQIAWTEDLSNVAEIAHCHHEKLDGTGYPRRLHADQIPLQARMMTISDIFDALTAMDRPYKRAISTERALDILSSDAKAGKIDPALLNIFIEARIYEVVQKDKKARLKVA